MCREEFSISQIKLHHSDAKDFVESAWFPAVVVTIYRFLFAGFCIGFIIFSGFHEANGNEKWFIYLTNWGFTFLTLYFIWSTIVCLMHHYKSRRTHTVIHMKASSKPEHDVEDATDFPSDEDSAPASMAWYHKGLWVIYNIAANSAIIITLLYWGLIFGGTTSVLDVSTHLINSVLIVADLMLSSVPVRLFHIVYPWVLCLSYILCTVIFWAVDGTNARDEPYIYSYIDYNKSPGLTSGILIGVFLVAQPLCQAILFGLFKLRCFLQWKCGRMV